MEERTDCWDGSGTSSEKLWIVNAMYLTSDKENGHLQSCLQSVVYQIIFCLKYPEWKW